MKDKILVVAVHPDDETLGCGGTLLKHKAKGDKVHWLICTNLNKNHVYHVKREKEIQKVSTLFNFDSVHQLKFETKKIDHYSISQIIDEISKVIKYLKPNTIYLPFKEDIHTDHKKIFEAAYSCTKSFRFKYINKIYMMETLSETEFSPSTKESTFIPNTFVDISKYINKKVQIMKIYKSEIDNHPFPRSETSIKALASFRGSSSGCKFAESFVLLKEIK